VVVAVIAMLMVQPPLDKVVNMIAVRHRFMAAPGTMDVTGLVALMAGFRGASVRIFLGHLDDVGLTVAATRMVKLAVMEIVDVVSMSNCDMAASWAVFVRMFRSSHGVPHFEEIWR
jgi:hypothetical protein